MIPARRSLLARLGAGEPRLLRLCAPPGYGKTEIARAWARRFDRQAVCDCTGLSSTIDFAGRLMSALADESQAGGDAIARMQLLLHATNAGEAAWSRALLEGWKVRQERALLILENADAVGARPSTLAMLGDLLAARPPERSLIISSRTALPLDVARYLAPHQILSLTREELRIDEAEFASIFDETDLPRALLERTQRLADGWPIALQLLARIAHYEPDVSALLDRADTLETALHEYLLDEVLSALTPEMAATMFAVAAIPLATIEDISMAAEIRHAAPIVENLLRLPGFISYESGTYRLHPLLHRALRARFAPDFSDYLERAARGNELFGDFVRAAELYNVAGDDGAGADALDRLPISALERPAPRLVETLVKIPAAKLCARPNLWMALLQYRRQAVDAEGLYEEANALQRAVSQSSPGLARRLGARAAMLALELGRVGEARAAIDRLGEVDAPEESPEERRIACMTAAVVAAKQGRFFEADAFVARADAIHDPRRLRFNDERALIARERALMHGDWDEVLKGSEERLTVALRSGPSERIAEAAQAVARAAWYCDDDERASAVQQIVGEAPAPAPEWQRAFLLADLERASQLFDGALSRLDANEDHFLRIVVRVCAALLVPEQRRRLIEARGIAKGIESQPLHASLELLIDSPQPRDFGIFGGLAARAARSPLKVRTERLFVDVFRGEVRRGLEVLHVSDRGLELLAALALYEAGTPTEELAAALWPRLDRKAAVNALKMCVSRTRTQVADRDAIQNGRNGYVLGDHVGSDVREFERMLHSVRGAGTLGEAAQKELASLLNAWSERMPPHAAGWAWFDPFAAHFGELRRELARAAGDGAPART